VVVLDSVLFKNQNQRELILRHQQQRFRARGSDLVKSRMFVGRERDIEIVEAFFAAGGHILALTGPGGVGKTSVAKRFTAACFCDLAQARKELAIWEALARALKLPPKSNAQEAVADVLRDRMIVLDNCEQALDAVTSVVMRLRERAPNARFLVTSREPLHLREEKVHELGPLPPEQALELFVQRASLVRPIERSEANLADIRSITARLDGLPLAIELAAARTGSLSLSELEERLSVTMLRDAARDRPSRQHSMRAAIDGSYEALTPLERAAFEAFSVFCGSFGLSAASAILGQDALEIVEALRSKSLLARVPSHRESRFVMYETIREYAAEKLGKRTERIRDRHAAYFTRDAMQKRAKDLNRALLDDLDNLLAVHTRALGRNDATMAVQVLRISSPLYHMRGPFDAFLGQIERTRAVPSYGSLAASMRAEVLFLRATFKRLRGDPDGARADADEALSLQPKNDIRADALTLLGHLDCWRGDISNAEKRFRQAASLFEDRWREGKCFAGLGMLMVEIGRPDEARDTLARALACLEAEGDTHATAHVLAMGGLAAQELGDFAAARAAFERAHAMAVPTGDERYPALIRGCLGGLLLETGNFAGAIAMYDEALSVLRRLGDRRTASLYSAFRAAARASQGTIEDDALEDARNTVKAINDGLQLAAVNALEGHLDLARARQSDRPNDHRRRARARLRQAEAQLAVCYEIRFAVRLLRVALALSDSSSIRDDGTLAISEDGAWARLPHGPRIAFADRPLLARLVRHLAHRRVLGEVATPADLLAAGWPGERIDAAAAANRLRVAIAKTRQLGLRELLVNRDGGYTLDAPVTIVPVNPSERES
jgi:predicted ATPase